MSALENLNYEITGEELLKSDYENIPSLVEPILQRIGLACLAGSSDTGKSLLLRQLAIAISTGEREFLGFMINAKSNSVIYVSTEDNNIDTFKLLKSQARDKSPEELNSLRFIFDSEDLENRLDNSLSSNPADLVVIDCLLDCFNGDLKDTTQIRKFLRRYQNLAEKHGCLILYLHHTGKRTEDSVPSKNNFLSGQGFEAKMRMGIEFRNDKSNPNQKHLCIVKCNYLANSYKTVSYLLELNQDTLTYTNTGRRIPFELLSSTARINADSENYKKIMELKSKNLSYEKIAKELDLGVKSNVSKIIDRVEKRTPAENLFEIEELEGEEFLLVE